MFVFLQIFCTLLSSTLIALAIPNEFIEFGSPLIGILALFPFYIAMARTKSYIRAFALCFLHGAVAHLLSSFWLGNFPGFAIFTLGASDLGTGFFEGFFSIAFFFPKLFSSKSKQLAESAGIKHFSVPLRIFWFASVYTIWEYCKSTGFLAYPWGTISMTAYNWNTFTQIADITGVYGITFLFSLFSAILGEGALLLGEISNSDSGRQIFSSYKKVFLTAAIFLLMAILYGAYRLSETYTPIKTMNTVLVQQNRNPTRKFEDENIIAAEEITQKKLDELKASGTKCDLVVWSEAVLSRRFPVAELYYNYMPQEAPLLEFVRKNKIPFVIGGPIVFDDEKHEYGNSALLFDGEGKYLNSYTKMHLVPFAELIPLRQYEPIRLLIKSMIGFSYGWTPGKIPVIFEIPLTQNDDKAFISTPICFDDSAHEVCHALYHAGSEIFVNITNDSWSKTDSSEIQHFVVAHYRSIEYRTTTIRAANAGYTCVIDPKGKVLADLPLFVDGALFYEVPIFERKMTVYAIFGDWLPYSLIFLSFAYIFFTVRQKRKEERFLQKIETNLLPYPLEWYETLEKVTANYERYFAIDWNNWNL